MRDCDVTLVVSPVERELLAVEAPRRARRGAVERARDQRRAACRSRSARDLWFVGGFQHPPNVDAMQWFVREVWPRIARALPEASSTSSAARCPTRCARSRRTRVVAHGHVPDLAPFLDGCRIARRAAALRRGREGQGQPEHGARAAGRRDADRGRGHARRDGRDALVAEDAQAFADAVVRLYHDEALWRELAANGLRQCCDAFFGGCGAGDGAAGVLWLGVSCPKTRLSPAARASYFLCWHKESNQRKCLPRQSGCEASGRLRCGFSDETSMSRQKTAGIHAGRPPGLETYGKTVFSVIPSAARDLLVGKKKQIPRCARDDKVCGAVAFALSRSMHALHPSRPEGRRTGCAPFSDRAMDGESENPGHALRSLFSSDRGRHFLLVTFLCASKEKLPARKGGSVCF